MSKCVWITWEEQRRNKPIAEEIGAIYYQISDTLKYPRVKRYFINIWRTFNIIRKEKPSVVISQNPSFVLAIISILFSKVFGFKVGLDTHNFGFGLPSDTNSKIMHILGPWVQKNADFVIAHNPGLKEQIKNRGGDIVVLPDKIPSISRPNDLKPLDGKHNLLFVSTFAVDEPWKNVIDAFKQMSSDYHLYVTGNYKKVSINPDDYPSNIHFTGRVDWDEYDRLLYSADVIIDLTTRDNCLLCGAYEAVACEKPLILSDTTALKSYFRRGSTYTNNSSTSIKDAITEMCNNHDFFSKEIKELKTQLQEEWGQYVSVLKHKTIN